MATRQTQSPFLEGLDPIDWSVWRLAMFKSASFAGPRVVQHLQRLAAS